jgi:dTDP-4-dehydrorhamnose 3,5-epimerase
MIEGVIIKSLSKYKDERGWLSEIWRNDELNFQPAMGYVSITKAGVSRGPHEHVNQSDCFIFVGPGSFDLYLWDRRKDSETFKNHVKINVGEKNPCLVVVPPGVVHGYKCVSDVSAMSINLPNKLYKGEKKSEEIDEIRWENKEDSPYRIA